MIGRVVLSARQVFLVVWISSFFFPATSNISGGICLNASKAETRLDMATLLLGRRSVRGTIGFGLYPGVGFLTRTRSVRAFPDHPIIGVLVPNRL